MKKLFTLLGLGALGLYLYRRGSERVQGVMPKATPDDNTLADKVQSEIFRDAEVPKGQINVNAEHGVVVLRGEVDGAELIRDLEERTRKIQGVRDVENLLHLPGEPAPTK